MILGGHYEKECKIIIRRYGRRYGSFHGWLRFFQQFR